MQPILKVNLTTGETEEYLISEKWEQDFLGGASLAARLLYDDLTPELDALSPDAPLLFINGPLTGTIGPTTGRFVICGKGPATGLWAESHIGGFWGPELRKAGYDGLWITGRAQKPVYLWINEGRLEVRDAAGLWGLDTYETQARIQEEVGRAKARVATIGEAGERGVLFAGIFCDHGRTAGRTGLGAVMGAKNLKAVAVYGKKGTLPLARSGVYAELRSEANRVLRQDNQTQVMHELGTASAANYFEYMGSMPAKYYHQGIFPAVDSVSGARMAESILSGTSACQGCVIACGRVVTLEDGARRKGPEYETIAIFGPNLLIDDLAAITRLGELCDRYGMDTISMGNTIGLAFHLFDQGRIKPKDLDGLHLRWGDVDTVEKLIHFTAKREGIGEVMAQGARFLGRYFGAEEEAVQVNGLEVACHDPRGVSGMALSYATSPRGACHNQSDYFLVDMGTVSEEAGIEYFSRHDGAEKAANMARHQDWRTVNNALVMCLFANVPPQTQVDLINAACGLDWDVEEMMRCGERGWNLKRVINHRIGLTRANDKLPKALLEPLNEGGAEGYVIPFDEMLRAYYEARDWDFETGRPSKRKLEALCLADVAEDLYG
ncbi:MAG: aldehyde ferredoxin oxidoreductase family protein [Anaerolineales bacterium]